jgi:hypothetical protein
MRKILKGLTTKNKYEFLSCKYRSDFVALVLCFFQQRLFNKILPKKGGDNIGHKNHLLLILLNNKEVQNEKRINF